MKKIKKKRLTVNGYLSKEYWVSIAFLKVSSNGLTLCKSLNNPMSSHCFRNFVGVGVWSSETWNYINMFSFESREGKSWRILTL